MDFLLVEKGQKLPQSKEELQINWKYKYNAKKYRDAGKPLFHNKCPEWKVAKLFLNYLHLREIIIQNEEETFFLSQVICPDEFSVFWDSKAKSWEQNQVSKSVQKTILELTRDVLLITLYLKNFSS